MSRNKATGTREWASFSANCMSGCKHGCLYCYARAKDKRGPNIPWTTELPLPPKQFTFKSGTIMFPTQHDITSTNVEICAVALHGMLMYGNEVLVVSKPNLEVIKTLIDSADLMPFRDKLQFRFTIGSQHDSVLKFWEPGAPNFAERLRALGYCAWLGFKTSVSMEPMLNLEEQDILDLVKILTPFVTDSIWLGKMNSVVERLKTNGVFFDNQAEAGCLVHSQSDERIKHLYGLLNGQPKIKWKNSIKTVMGLDLAEEVGLDI